VPAFTVGQLDPARGYVHVLDDTSLNVLLMTLDTIADFVTYLRKKEQLILSDRLVWAAGEDDLLAYYLQDVNDQGEHDFLLPGGATALTIGEGMWERFCRGQARRSQLQADKVSYLWDELIERFNAHILMGTQFWASHPSIADQELGMRFLARVPRFHRRMLAGALVDMLKTTPETIRRTRVFPPMESDGSYFVLLLLPHFPGMPNETYREARRSFLLACCRVVRLQYPDAEDIVGVATESGIGHPDDPRSEDALYYDARQWDEAERNAALEAREELGLLTNATVKRSIEKEYPAGRGFSPRGRTPTPMRMKGRDRNKPCPCGSGKKFKNCCG
jgi:hypothetical protein